MVAILNPTWPPKYKNSPIWTKFGNLQCLPSRSINSNTDPVECWWDSILKVLRVMNFNYKNNAHYKGDKVYQWLITGWWFSLGSLISSTNKTDCHDIAEILLKVALNTITLTHSLVMGIVFVIKINESLHYFIGLFEVKELIIFLNWLYFLFLFIHFLWQSSLEFLKCVSTMIHRRTTLFQGWIAIFLGTLVSSTNKTDSHDNGEKLLKMALNTITLTLFLVFQDILVMPLGGHMRVTLYHGQWKWQLSN
jgi:hypothetical protein